MHIIQSYWSRGCTDLLTERGGWMAPEYNLMGWALSCLQLRKFYDHVTLYTDETSARILIDLLQLPYTNTICTLDELNHYNKGLWALPKIYAYADQKEPFLHVDGDVFIWEKFSHALMQKGLIAQNKEISTAYSEKAMLLLEETLAYFPEEILAERKQQNKIYAYNAGIFGGNDILFFKEFAAQSFDFVERNLASLSDLNVFHFNIIFEQYLFYCLAQKQQKKIDVLFEGLYTDHGYKGFSDFIDVPFNRTYLHLMGPFKRHSRICTEMAAKLRDNYPEYYYRIIELFRGKKIPLKNDYYYFLPEANQQQLINRFTNYKNNTADTDPDTAYTEKLFVYEKTQVTDQFIARVNEPVFKEVSLDYIRESVLLFENSIAEIIKANFKNINRNLLYKRDVLNSSYGEYIFNGKEKIYKKILVAEDHYEILTPPFDWSLLENIEKPLEEVFSKLIDSASETNYIAVIPECCPKGYSLLQLGYLDILMLDILKQPASIEQLLREISKLFPPEEIENAYDKFTALIYDRIKNALSGKLIRPIKEITG